MLCSFNLIPIFLMGRSKTASVNFGSMLQLSLEVSHVGHIDTSVTSFSSQVKVVCAVTLLTGSFAVKQAPYLFLD